MKKVSKQVLAIILTFCVLLLVTPMLLSKVQATNYSKGDIIKFGLYPQSEVTDTATISALNAILNNGKWVSYDYYSGDGWDSFEAGDYMKYADVIYNGKKYRAVKFSSYRPEYTYELPTAKKSYQDDHGYYIDTVYWFEYEPIEWYVLDAETGYIMCKTIIDSQAYYNTPYSSYYHENGEDYANNYEKSSIREWLNDNFYNCAFTATQKSQIKSTELDNSAAVGYPKYDSASTTDKVFLVSYSEISNNSSGLDFSGKWIAQGSDYSKCQGLYVDLSEGEGERSSWLLRSAGTSGNGVCYVLGSSLFASALGVENTHYGIRPAMRIDLSSFVEESQTFSKVETTLQLTSSTTVELTESESNLHVTKPINSTTKPITTVPTVSTIPADEVEIKKPSQTEISYGDKIVLHVDVDLPDGAKIVWKPSNDNFSYSVSADGKSITISPESSGDTTFTAIIVDKNGEVISEEYTQTMTAKAGFLQKIIAFFKGLFGLNKVIPESVKFVF